MINIRVMMVGILFFSTASYAMGRSGEDLPNFREVVSDQVYRGAQPTAVGFRSLAQQGMKTVINLRSENPLDNSSEERIVTQLGMKYISIPMSGLVPPSDQEVDAALAILQDPTAWPVFVHCRHGKDRTGITIGIYRVEVQNWMPRDAYNEMLDIGFNQTLLGLKHYFKKRVGL